MGSYQYKIEKEFIFLGGKGGLLTPLEKFVGGGGVRRSNPKKKNLQIIFLGGRGCGRSTSTLTNFKRIQKEKTYFGDFKNHQKYCWRGEMTTS